MGNVQIRAIEENEVKKARFFINELESDPELEEFMSKDDRKFGRLQQLKRRANDSSLLNVELFWAGRAWLRGSPSKGGNDKFMPGNSFSTKRGQGLKFHGLRWIEPFLISRMTWITHTT